jgi:hypothetical protein
MSGDSFGIEKESLEALLSEASSGSLQLPEFQRSWVWPVENMVGLLASISLNYPVGTLMLLKSGGDLVRFKHRALEGAQFSSSVMPERLLLDGQQRLTSLYRALMLAEPVVTQDARKRKVSGWFYVSIADALDPSTDREDAIRFIPESKQVVSFRGEVVEDYSTPEREFAAGMFPLVHVFDPDVWEDGYSTYWEFDADRLKEYRTFRKSFIRPFQMYQLPVIELGRETDRRAVCQVFEKVNTGGVTLTVFELLTATFAADGFDLRKDWSERRQILNAPEFKILRDVKETDFLQAVTLLATRDARLAAQQSGVEEDRLPRLGCRRSEMLELNLDAYRRHAGEIVAGLKAAAKFLHRQGFFDPKFLPYGGQIVPLSAILAVLGTNAENQATRERLEQWFWCGVLGELYGGATETRFARDLPEVLAWATGGDATPKTVVDSNFAPQRLDTLRTRNSAAYKGIYTLLVRDGAKDWRTGAAITAEHYFDESVDIHHIFPMKWCEDQSIPMARYDTIVNKTALTARTNRAIGGRAPSEYRGRLESSAGITTDVLNTNVSSHRVSLNALWTDDFDGFYIERSRQLLELISRATGKPVSMTTADDGIPIDEEEPDEHD